MDNDTQNVSIDNWHKMDFKSQVSKRLNGITKESFQEDVEIWQMQLQTLPTYNEEKLREEISKWDWAFPSHDDFRFESLYETYSLQVSYRTRLVEIIGQVNAHAEMFTQAHKALEKAAFKVFSKSGGSVDDKKADAAHAVAPFLWGAANSKRFLSYLTEVLEAIEFSAMQLARLLREREALGKINSSYEREGHSQSFKGIQNAQIGGRHFRELSDDDEEEL